MVDDEGDGFEQNGVLGVGVLDLLGLGRLLGFVEDGLQTLCETTPQRSVLCNTKGLTSQSRWLFLFVLPCSAAV